MRRAVTRFQDQRRHPEQGKRATLTGQLRCVVVVDIAHQNRGLERRAYDDEGEHMRDPDEPEAAEPDRREWQQNGQRHQRPQEVAVWWKHVFANRYP